MHTQVGEAKAAAAQEGQAPFKKGVYFLGKVLWAKGYTELLDRLNEHEQRTGQHVPVDVYGNGPDAKVCVGVRLGVTTSVGISVCVSVCVCVCVVVWLSV